MTGLKWFAGGKERREQAVVGFKGELSIEKRKMGQKGSFPTC